MSKFSEAGWVWEGQGVYPGVPASIFGAGEGARFFGVSKAVFMFHPNNDLAMRKMSWMKEITCDISKWKFNWPEGGGVALGVDSDPQTMISEAENVSRLSLTYPNITGAFHDDMRGLVTNQGISPSAYRDIYAAVKSANPSLKLWSVVYSHELDEDWEPFKPFMDIVNLWVWDSRDLADLDSHLDKCRTLFPDKPINIGCYLRDYPAFSPMPMDRLKFQWEHVARYVSEDRITGYSIIGAVLIDGQQEQAEWVREFIARQ